MKPLVLLFFLFYSFSIYSQATKEIIEKYDDGKSLKCVYTVLVEKPTIKHGAYISYFINGKIWEKGNYNNGMKLGGWTKYNDRGGLVYSLDHTLKKRRPSVDFINSLYLDFRYPPIARENEIEGEVVMEIAFDDDCNLIKCNVIASPDLSLSKESVRGFKTHITNSKKQGKIIEPCELKMSEFVVYFRLK